MIIMQCTAAAIIIAAVLVAFVLAALSNVLTEEIEDE